MSLFRLAERVGHRGKEDKREFILGNWVKKNEATLIGGLVPGAAIAIAEVAFHYSVWLALATMIVPFIVINGLILLLSTD